jgi:PleD family two-component response regulator
MPAHNPSAPLPLTPPPANSRDAVLSRPLAKQGILIVDDNPEKTLALQSVVEELDYAVVVASSAEAALRELLKRNFALALLDVHMPGMDGFELAALIRSRPAHQHLAIVFIRCSGCRRRPTRWRSSRMKVSSGS